MKKIRQKFVGLKLYDELESSFHAYANNSDAYAQSAVLYAHICGRTIWNSGISPNLPGIYGLKPTETIRLSLIWLIFNNNEENLTEK